MNSKNRFEIHVKGGFSERKGIKHFSDVVQRDSLNERTRSKLYTSTADTLNYFETYTISKMIAEYIYEEIFSKTKKSIPCYYSGEYNFKTIIEEVVYSIFMDYDFSDVFTFIEGIIDLLQLVDENAGQKSFTSTYIEYINAIFKNENVNYRIANGIVTDLVVDEEIESIEETLNNENDVVKKHYSKALEKLYKEKDYSNSIKESISAVEAMCQKLTNKNKATLSDALKELSDQIHPAMKMAFEKLYAYAGDANGIRHANGPGEGNATFEEAKFMLISCSAFINYLEEMFEKNV